MASNAPLVVNAHVNKHPHHRGSAKTSSSASTVTAAKRAPVPVMDDDLDDSDDGDMGTHVDQMMDNDMDDLNDDDSPVTTPRRTVAKPPPSVTAAIRAKTVAKKPSSSTAPATTSPLSARSNASSNNGTTAMDHEWKASSEVSQLLLQNNQLRSALENKEDEVTQLSEALLTLQQDFKVATNTGGGGHASMVDVSKDIIKKNRHLSVLLNRERGLVAKTRNENERLASLLAELGIDASQLSAPEYAPVVAAVKLAVQNAAKSNTTAAATAATGNGDGTVLSADEWKDRHDRVNGRLVESKMIVKQYQADNDKLRRALQKEVGDEVPLSMVLEETGKWRGRAQEIAQLKTKVKKLKRDLATATAQSSSANSGPSTGDAVAAAIAAATGQALDSAEYGGESSRSSIPPSRLHPPSTATAGTVLSGGERQRQHIASLQASRLQEMDDLLKTNMEQSELAAQQKKKIQALTARQRTLENDVGDLKEKLKVLLNKSSNDDKLIDGMKSELEAKDKQMASVMAARVSARVGSGGTVRSTSSSATPSGIPVATSGGSRSRPASGSGAAAAAAIAAANANNQSADTASAVGGARRGSTSTTSSATVAAKVNSVRAPAKSARQQQHEAELAQLRIQMESQIASQSRTILTLKSELAREQKARASHVMNLVNDWDRDDVERQLQLLTIDNEKKNELVLMYNERNKEMEEKMLAFGRRNAELEKRNVALETRLGARTTSSTAAKKAPPSKKEREAESALVLKERLDTAIAENTALRETYDANLAIKTNELRLLNDLLAQQRSLHTAAMTQLKHKVATIEDIARGSPSSAGGGDAGL